MPQSESWPFRRLMVDHLFRGTTRVWWSLDPQFNDPGPHLFQLQAGYTGNNNALDWVNIGTSAVNAYYLNDDTGREPTGKRLMTHYRVVLTTPRQRYISGPQGINGAMPEKDWLLSREILRKERLRLGLVSQSGYLIRRMRYGVINPANTDYLTQEITDSTHPASWGTAYKVGYHPPVLIQVDFDPIAITERRGGADIATNNSRPAEFNARVLGFPDLAKEDVWVDAATDQRWGVGDIKVVTAIRGIPLIYSVRFSLLPFSDVVYHIPVTQLSSDPTDTNKFQPTVGTGCVRVDHDYPTDSNMVYQAGDCCGITGATVTAFLKSDWDNGNRVPGAAKAISQTTTNGTWAWAMMLNPGDYVIQFEKLGEFGPDTMELTVETAPPPTFTSLGSSSVSSLGSEWGSDSVPANVDPNPAENQFGDF